MSEPDRGIGECLARVHSLVELLEAVAPPEANAAARELMQTLLELHRGGLKRVLALLGPAGKKPLEAACEREPQLAGLLLLHGLHPLSLEARVRQALGHIRPRISVQGTDVELLGIDIGLIRLRLRADRPSMDRTLRVVIEEILSEAAPDAEGIEWEGTPQAGDGRLSLPLIDQKNVPRA